MRYLPGTVNTNRGAASRTGKVPDLGRPLTIKRDTFEDILAYVEVPTTPQGLVQFAKMATSTPIERPGEHLMERTPQIGGSQVDLYSQGKLKKLWEPKVAKLKGGYSSDASFVFQSWLKDIWVHVMECCLTQWEAIQLVKDYTSKHAWLGVEYYLGLTPKSKQSFQGLIDHLSLMFQSCTTVSSVIWDFYNQSQKAQETKDTFADELQVLVRKIVACKPEFLGEVNQPPKHQLAYNLRDCYFGVVAMEQCLASPDSKSLTQFQGQLAMMFGSRGKSTKAIYATSVAVDTEDIGGHTKQDHLSHNSCKHQNKINAQATVFATVRSELNKALQENKKLENMSNPDQLVEAMTKVVSTMTVKECPKTSQGTQYKGASNYMGRQWQPQLAHGADGILEPNISCHYCKDRGHTKTTVPGWIIKLNVKCSCKGRWQLPK